MEPEEPRPRGEAYGFKKRKTRRHGNSQLCPCPPSLQSQQDPKAPGSEHTLKASTPLLDEKGLRVLQPENLARSCKECAPGEEGKAAITRLEIADSCGPAPRGRRFLFCTRALTTQFFALRCMPETMLPEESTPPPLRRRDSICGFSKKQTAVCGF